MTNWCKWLNERITTAGTNHASAILAIIVYTKIKLLCAPILTVNNKKMSSKEYIFLENENVVIIKKYASAISSHL